MHLQSRTEYLDNDIIEQWVSDDGTHGFGMWIWDGYQPIMFDILTRRPTPARALRDQVGATTPTEPRDG